MELLRGLSIQVMLTKIIYIAHLSSYIYTCCKCPCIHWASREYSTSTKSSLIDSETVVYVFMQSINCVLLVICVYPALMNIATTNPFVVDMVVLCVAGSYPSQTH